MNRSTLAAAGLVAGVLALSVAPAAMAAPLSLSHAVHHHAKAQKFNLKGVVTAVSGRQLQILVGTGNLGTRKLAGHSVQLNLPTHARAGHSVQLNLPTHANTPGQKHTPAVGDSVHAQGTAGSAGGAFTASQVEVQPSASGALVGVLDAVNGTTLMINVSAEVGSNSQGDQGGDDVAIDASVATVTMDGQASSVGQLTTGETVAVLGDTGDDSVLASQVMAYSTTPGTAAGTITQVSGNVLTLSSGDGQGDGNNQDGTTSSVDVTSRQIYLDGQSAATAGQLATGDDVLAIGTAATNPLAATVTFAFGQGGDSQGD